MLFSCLLDFKDQIQIINYWPVGDDLLVNGITRSWHKKVWFTGAVQVPVSYPHVRTGRQQEWVVRGAHEHAIDTVTGRLWQINGTDITGYLYL